MECGAIESPEGSCAVGSSIDTLRFKLEFCTCEEGENAQGLSCTDEGALPGAGESARVTCTDTNDNLLFSQNIQDGSDVIMSGEGGLPPMITCSVFSITGEILQSLTVDASGSTDLFLKDKFGSLTLEACDEQDCISEVTYIYTLQNNGAVDIEVTKFERDREGEIVDLLPEVTTLVPGESFVTAETESIDVCEDASICTTITMEDSTGNCGDTDEYCFEISTEPRPPTPEPTPVPTPDPTPAPSGTPTQPPVPGATPVPTPSPTPAPTAPETCEFELEIECPNCNATPPPVAQCEGRPLAMSWIYSGGGCENSWNVQGDQFICEDFNGGPPTNLGEKSFIVVTDIDGETVYHRDWVRVNSVYQHDSGNERFAANSLITIYKNNNTGDLANLLQSIQYHSSCSSTLFLKNRFGANILVQWTNEEQGTISCFANQTFNLEVDIPIDFEGGPATVTGLTVASNVDPYFFNLTESVFGVVANAGDTFSTSINVPVDLTEKRTYNMLITLTAETATGVVCTATDLVTFTAGYPLPPIFPTFAPTGAPSSAP